MSAAVKSEGAVVSAVAEYGVLATGPVFRQPATMPCRIVLRTHGAGEWVTHLQVLTEEGGSLRHFGFQTGHYHSDHAAALADFCERVLKAGV